MKHWRQSGDTLIEVILALVILVSVLVSALSLSRFAIVNSSNSLLRTQAINLVQEQYEALKDYHRRTPWEYVEALKYTQDLVYGDPTIDGAPYKAGHPDSSFCDYYDTDGPSVGCGVFPFNGPSVACEDASQVTPPPGYSGQVSMNYPATRSFYLPKVVGIAPDVSQLLNNTQHDWSYYPTASDGADPDIRCFHFERDSRLTVPGGSGTIPNPTYGNWVACPGRWYPPIGYDSNWNQNIGTGAEASTTTIDGKYFQHFYSSLGCRGNARTQPTQPNIYVGLSTDILLGRCTSIPATVSFINQDYMSVAVMAAWQKVGTSGGNVSSLGPRGYTRMYTILGNDTDYEGCSL